MGKKAVGDAGKFAQVRQMASIGDGLDVVACDQSQLVLPGSQARPTGRRFLPGLPYHPLALDFAHCEDHPLCSTERMNSAQNLPVRISPDAVRS